jgi:hypothetical protein
MNSIDWNKTDKERTIQLLQYFVYEYSNLVKKYISSKQKLFTIIRNETEPDCDDETSTSCLEAITNLLKSNPKILSTLNSLLKLSNMIKDYERAIMLGSSRKWKFNRQEIENIFSSYENYRIIKENEKNTTPAPPSEEIGLELENLKEMFESLWNSELLKDEVVISGIITKIIDKKKKLQLERKLEPMLERQFSEQLEQIKQDNLLKEKEKVKGIIRKSIQSVLRNTEGGYKKKSKVKSRKLKSKSKKSRKLKLKSRKKY